MSEDNDKNVDKEKYENERKFEEQNAQQISKCSK